MTGGSLGWEVSTAVSYIQTLGSGLSQTSQNGVVKGMATRLDPLVWLRLHASKVRELRSYMLGAAAKKRKKHNTRFIDALATRWKEQN